MAVSVGRDVCVLSGGSKSRKSSEDARKTSKVEIDKDSERAQTRDVSHMSLDMDMACTDSTRNGS
jgi:hypothetical protein